MVATPTGSTAYAFSAGGPILDPRLRNLVIAPIAAYLSALRSVVTDLSWQDAWSAVPAIVALGLAALIAAAIPALRAARSDPKVALT